MNKSKLYLFKWDEAKWNDASYHTVENHLALIAEEEPDGSSLALF